MVGNAYASLKINEHESYLFQENRENLIFFPV